MVTASREEEDPFAKQQRELFYYYDINKACSAGQADVPFEPSRTVEVDRRSWERYSHPPSHEPQNGAAAPAARRRAAGWRDWLLRCGRRPSGGGKAPSDRGRSIFGLPMLRPDSKRVWAWDVCMTLVDLTYTAFMVPISLAFDFAAAREGPYFSWLTIMDVAGTGFYLTDILISFHVGFIVRFDVQRALVMQLLMLAALRAGAQGRRVAGFIKHGTFPVDFIATVAVVPEIVLASIGQASRGYNWFYMMRLLRLLRVARLLRAVGGTVLVTNPVSRAALQRTSTAFLYLLNLCFSLAVLVNLLGCLWWFCAQMEGLPNSWVAATDFDYDLLTSSRVSAWVASVYFATTTVATVGYGDITPVTVAEQAVVVGMQVVGVLFFGFSISVIGDLLSSSSRNARLADQLRAKLEDTEAWMEERRLPGDLRKKVQRFYPEVWAQHGGVQDAEYFADLPVALRGEIVARLAGPALRRSHVLRRLDEGVRGQLAAAAAPVRLVAGHNLYSEGDPCTSFFFLQEGEALAIRGAHVTAAFKSPALVGQAAIFAPEVEACRTRLQTVRGLTNCTLWEFKSSDLQNVTKHRPDVMVTLCRAYLEYLKGAEEVWRRHARGMPKRVPRMQQGVRELLQRMEEKARREGSGGGSHGGSDSQPKDASPTAVERVTAGQTPASTAAPALSRPSYVESVAPSEAEQLSQPASEDDDGGPAEQPGPGGSRRQQRRGGQSPRRRPGAPLSLGRDPSLWVASEDGSLIPEEESLEDLEAGQAPASPAAGRQRERGEGRGAGGDGEAGGGRGPEP